MHLSNATNEASNSLLSSPSFFDEFAGKRSWESGWLSDFRKENWEKATNVTSNLKDERWRFSPKARLGYSKVSGLAKSEDSISFDSPEQKGFVLEHMDRMILENPNALLDLPDLTGPEMGAEESFLFARAFSAAGFL